VVSVGEKPTTDEILSRLKKAPAGPRVETPTAADPDALIARLRREPEPSNGDGVMSADEALGRMRKSKEPSDLGRILALPTRPDDFVPPDLTDRLALPEGTMRLRTIQNAALHEIEQTGGLLGPIGVGHGKTGVAFLAPLVLKAKRPLLLIPAKMRQQCVADWEMWGRHFHMPGRLTVRTYEQLSSAKRSNMLRILRPDLIIADEAHKLRHPQTSRTRRLARYLKANPDTRFLAMSGTVTRKAISDYNHLARWGLGKGSPLPLTYPLLMSFRAVLEDDRKPEAVDEVQLRRLCAAMDEPDPRAAFRRRLVTAPGVVATSDQGVGASLLLTTRSRDAPDGLQAVINEVQATWQAPNDDEIEDGLAMSRVLRQLICGFYYYWDWSPQPWDGEPDHEWLECRRVWHRAVRETLQRHADEGFDSPMLLALSCQRGWRPHQGGRKDVPEALATAWDQWQPHRHKKAPPTLAAWLSDYLIEDVMAWASTQDEPPLVWYGHTTFGERLAERTGWAHYGPGVAASREIRAASERDPVPAVVSIPAHGEGKNLQNWGNQLVAHPVSSGATYEQMLGRTHRAGQERDEVLATAYVHGPFESALEKADADAAYIEETTGQHQRLGYAIRVLEGAGHAFERGELEGEAADSGVDPEAAGV